MMAIFTADYVFAVQRSSNALERLIRLSGVMALTVGFIIAEPDLGATVVIVMMVGVFFLAGAPQLILNYAWCNFGYCF
jgi:cell division protein FtsW